MIVLALRAAHAATAEPPVRCLDGLPQDLILQVVKSTDTSALRNLKAVGKEWFPRARQELCTRLRSYGGEVIDGEAVVDVEGLCAAGQLHKVVAAGRELPDLAWLHGYGFKVDVTALRQIDLHKVQRYTYDEGKQHALNRTSSLDALWAAPSAHVLRACITPSDSMPPRELLLAAFACAGKGKLLGVPVQHLRDGTAHLRRGPGKQLQQMSLIDEDGIELLALLLPGSKVKHLEHAPRPEPTRALVVFQSPVDA